LALPFSFVANKSKILPIVIFAGKFEGDFAQLSVSSTTREPPY